jgi:hypothetical protein
MPLMRYFIFVGGALLALLFIADACLPALPVVKAARSDTDLSVIRIHSDTKWPERVVFDTTRPTITPVPAPMVAEAVAPQEKIAAAPSKGGVREAFAQLPATPSHPKLKRKPVAKNYAGPNYPGPNYAAPNYAGPPRMLVAQQRPMGFFGNNVW